MAPQNGIRGPHQELKDAIATGRLSGPLLKNAEGILDRIEAPVRLGILGLPQGGKSLILNFLLGASVVPEDVRLPTISLSYGLEPTAVCTLRDGSKQTVNGADMRAVADLNPVFVDAVLPLPALAKISVLEVVASSDPVEQQRAILWASKRLDMALWCSSGSFEEEEQDLWGIAPETLQDHSFLMLSKGDESLDQRVTRATSNGRDYFKKVFPIDTRMAIGARASDGSVDKEKLRSSGGIALISAVLRDVEAGKQNSIDQAEVFLRQVDLPTPEPLVKPAQIELVEEVSTKVELPPESTPPDAPEITEVAKLTPASRAAMEQCVEQLSAEGEAMVNSFEAGTLDETTVLENCVDTVIWLAEYLSNSGEVNDPTFAQSQEAAVDAADLVQLIQLESGDSIASDALSLMVQLKQELQASLAA
jgi:hypothetical protein